MRFIYIPMYVFLKKFYFGILLLGYRLFILLSICMKMPFYFLSRRPSSFLKFLTCFMTHFFIQKNDSSNVIWKLFLLYHCCVIILTVAKAVFENCCKVLMLESSFPLVSIVMLLSLPMVLGSAVALVLLDVPSLNKWEWY